MRLEMRLGPALARKRLRIQRGKEAGLLHQGEGIFRIERMLPVDRLLTGFLKLCGLWNRGRRNFFDVRVVRQEWELERLPIEFDGFRLLQLSDLHIDLDPGLWPVVARLTADTSHDAAVVTGDYRNSTKADFRPSVEAIIPVIEALGAPRWGILGNHDFLEMTAPLERAGLPILLNEAAVIRRGGAELWICGVDDPHFYRTHDFAAACKNIPRDACRILLAHSPEVADEAASHGYDWMLSGHIHGGQICLPGGKPLVLPVKSLPRDLVAGRWKRGKMQGYTSRGTGGCGVAARFNCPPEITLHTLRRASPPRS